MIEQMINVQVTINEQDGNEAHVYVPRHIMISEGKPSSVKDAIRDKLHWAYDTIAKQVYETQNPIIVLPIESKINQYPEMYEGVHIIPLLWWELIEPIAEIALINDHLIESYFGTQFENTSLTEMYKTVELMQDTQKLYEQQTENGLLIFGVAP